MVKFKIIKFNSCKKDFYDKLIGSFTKKGLKIKVKKYVNKAFQRVQVQTGYSFAYILTELLVELNTFIEVRQVYIRNKMIFVPFFISLERRFFLAIKWFIKGVNDNKNKLSFVDKLVFELLSILKIEPFKTSKAISHKNLNDTLAVKNRSNIHYRW